MPESKSANECTKGNLGGASNTGSLASGSERCTPISEPCIHVTGESFCHALIFRPSYLGVFGKSVEFRLVREAKRAHFLVLSPKRLRCAKCKHGGGKKKQARLGRALAKAIDPANEQHADWVLAVIPPIMHSRAGCPASLLFLKVWPKADAPRDSSTSHPFAMPFQGLPVFSPARVAYSMRSCTITSCTRKAPNRSKGRNRQNQVYSPCETGRTASIASARSTAGHPCAPSPRTLYI